MATAVRQKISIYAKQYDPAGRLTSVSVPGGFSSTIGYDGFGRKASVVHSDGSSGSFQHDLLNRITAVSWTGPTPVSENLSRDLAGNITTVQRENSPATQIAYDAVDQLVSSTGAETRSYTLDLLGNRLGDSLNGNGNFVSNFLLSNGVTTYQADPDGFGDTIKETSAAGVKNYAYRADDLLNAVQNGATQVAYYFDALGRRVAKIFNLGGTSFTQSFVYLGKEDQILMAKAGDGTITTYIDGADLGDHLAEVKNGVGKGYVTDHLGSVLNSDLAGSAHLYSLFGIPSANVSVSANSTPVDYGFAGFEHDSESAADHTHWRQYFSGVGRWSSQDPIGMDGGINYYGYVGGNPVRRTDRTGQNYDPNPGNETPEQRETRCEKGYDSEYALCGTLRTSEERAICYGTATTRYSECLKDGEPRSPLAYKNYDTIKDCNGQVYVPPIHGAPGTGIIWIDEPTPVPAMP